MSSNPLLKDKHSQNIIHNPVTAWVILAVLLALTAAVYRVSNDLLIKRARDRFEFQTSEVRDAIRDRLRVYEQVLWSGVGLMYASENVTREEFAKFVETLAIDKHWPGIQGIGFSIPVKPEEREAHIARIRSEGFPEFTINPSGEREMYSSIIFLEPFDWRNKRAFGYDMWSNDMRRKAMMRARDEGVAATSGIITLVQETEEDQQKGFLTYVPVYRNKNIPRSVKERREEFAGWVYAPFRAGNLITGILNTDNISIDFKVFDGREMKEDALLFDNTAGTALKQAGRNPFFERTEKVINQGRAWTLYFSAPKEFLSKEERLFPRGIVIFGILIDVLFFYFIWSFYFINKKAITLAEEMSEEAKKSRGRLEYEVKERTAELKEARDDLEAQVNERTKELHKKLGQMEKMNTAMVGREKVMISLKKENERLKKELGLRE